MITKDLIKKLEQLVADHEPCVEVMGEHEIMIDMFDNKEPGQLFEYGGFSPEINIEKSADGVYDILSAFKRK